MIPLASPIDQVAAVAGQLEEAVEMHRCARLDGQLQEAEEVSIAAAQQWQGHQHPPGSIKEILPQIGGGWIGNIEKDWFW